MHEKKNNPLMVTPCSPRCSSARRAQQHRRASRSCWTASKASFEPVSTELVEINGVPTLTKTFELAPDVDPALLREEPFSQDGYWYRYQRMDKSDQEITDEKEAEETVTVDAPSGELADVIGQFPATRQYSKDGYTGELLVSTCRVSQWKPPGTARSRTATRIR